MGYCKKGVMKGKIAVCVRDRQGQKVAYIGRNLTGQNRYFFYKGYKHDHIFNLHRADPRKVLILTPSAFDCALISQTHPNAAALLQGSLSEAQAQLLRDFRAIHLVHRSPGNIPDRLARYSFVKNTQIIGSLTLDMIRGLV